MKHGYGILNSVSTNQVYDGNFESGLKHGIKNFWYLGEGTMYYSYGDIYEGEWKNGLKSGYGELKYADGSIYEG